ncbi:hypothetical protein GGR50DRAFT_695110 [Xylaria sp. CBS 124048]|nr:hypothetical protein GGR50DRAFT_695110 [Xylaria sp. CBS 124048]
MPRRVAPLVRPTTEESTNLFRISNREIKERFRVPLNGYTPSTPGDHSTEIAWGAYLDAHNYRLSFRPLEGSERDRYGPIIDESQDQESRRVLMAVEVMDTIISLLRALRDIWSRSGGNPQARVISRPLMTLYFRMKHYIEKGLRYKRVKPRVWRKHFTTRLGDAEPCYVDVNDKHWYSGHKPGDPIAQIRERRADVYNIFYVAELAGTEDGDEVGNSTLRFEGVVPFNTYELYQRYSRYAWYSFVRMVIAALAFDPEDDRQQIHDWVESHSAFKDLQTKEYAELSKETRTGFMRLFRRVWRIKYGKKPADYPEFLKAQIATSISRFREMGWLMLKIERKDSARLQCSHWRHCKALLQEVTGRTLERLAKEYVDITLRQEAEEAFVSFDPDLLLYIRVNQAEDQQLHDFYHSQGPELQLSARFIKKARSEVERHRLRIEALSTQLFPNDPPNINNPAAQSGLQIRQPPVALPRHRPDHEIAPGAPADDQRRHPYPQPAAAAAERPIVPETGELMVRWSTAEARNRVLNRYTTGPFVFDPSGPPSYT